MELGKLTPIVSRNSEEEDLALLQCEMSFLYS